MSAALSALIRQYQDRTESTFRLSCAATAGKTVDRSAVLYGSYRASWTANNGPPKTNNINIDEGDSGRNDLTGVINSLKVGDTFSFANGQPYGPRLEYEGWSAKSPSGSLRISIAEWPDDVARAARGR